MALRLTESALKEGLSELQKGNKKSQCFGICKDCQIIYEKVKELEKQIDALQAYLLNLSSGTSPKKEINGKARKIRRI